MKSVDDFSVALAGLLNPVLLANRVPAVGLRHTQGASLPNALIGSPLRQLISIVNDRVDARYASQTFGHDSGHDDDHRRGRPACRPAFGGEHKLTRFARSASRVRPTIEYSFRPPERPHPR